MCLLGTLVILSLDFVKYFYHGGEGYECISEQKVFFFFFSQEVGKKKTSLVMSYVIFLISQTCSANNKMLFYSLRVMQA